MLNLKNPAVSEVKKYANKTNKRILYEIMAEKTNLIWNVAKAMRDKTLLFSVAVCKKDFEAIIKSFDQFEEAVKEDYALIDKLGDVVALLIKNKFRNEEISKKLLRRHIGAKYDKRQISYLASQVNNFEFIKKCFNKGHIEKDVVLLERLTQINKQKTLEFIENKKDLVRKHWTDVATLFAFLKRTYDELIIKKYIACNIDAFRTSSHLKNHLKDIGIYISTKSDGNIAGIR